MTAQILRLEEQLSIEREQHASYREIQAGQQRHYENMLLECGELRQRAFDDG